MIGLLHLKSWFRWVFVIRSCNNCTIRHLIQGGIILKLVLVDVCIMHSGGGIHSQPPHLKMILWKRQYSQLLQQTLANRPYLLTLQYVLICGIDGKVVMPIGGVSLR